MKPTRGEKLLKTTPGIGALGSLTPAGTFGVNGLAAASPDASGERLVVIAVVADAQLRRHAAARDRVLNEGGVVLQVVDAEAVTAQIHLAAAAGARSRWQSNVRVVGEPRPTA